MVDESDKLFEDGVAGFRDQVCGCECVCWCVCVGVYTCFVLETMRKTLNEVL